MIATVTLIVLGAVLLGLEVFAPGAILGIVGVLCLGAAAVVAGVNHGLVAGVVVGLAGVVLTVLTLWLEFSLLPRSRSLRALSVGTGTSGSKPDLPADPAAVVGQSCTAVTTLAPSGYVRLGDKRFQARCDSGHAESGAVLRVVSVEPFQLVVTQS